MALRPRALVCLLLGGSILACGARSALRVRPLDGPDGAVTDLGAEAGRDVASAPEAFDCRTDPARSCDDGDACTTDRCLPTGACAHAAIVCDDDDPCTANRCEPARGCTFPAVECGGCADGERDAFRDRARYPDIAGCAGAQDGPPGSFWATRQTGPGCLQCATGTALDCSGNDCRGDCATTPATTNDLFGCGSLGSSPQPSCAPLDRSSNNLCAALAPPWRCDQPTQQANLRESEHVVKPGPGAGGVLCCRD